MPFCFLFICISLSLTRSLSLWQGHIDIHKCTHTHTQTHSHMHTQIKAQFFCLYFESAYLSLNVLVRCASAVFYGEDLQMEQGKLKYDVFSSLITTQGFCLGTPLHVLVPQGWFSGLHWGHIHQESTEPFHLRVRQKDKKKNSILPFC